MNRIRVRQALHYLAAVLGIALLVALVRRTGTGTVVHQVKTIGWGFGLVLLLGGIGHLIKTWAWRLTFACEIKNISFARTFALRLVSEAIAILGLPGQVIGEAARVSLLGSDVPIANSISSVTLDRGLYIVTSAIVTFTGMITALLLMSFSRMWRLYALLFALGAAAMLAASALALLRRWPVFSGVARAIGRITWFKGWLDGKRSVIESAEKNLFDFCYETPGAFLQSVALNVACHGTAILEVYILLCFMGARSGLFLALVLEALTKLINIVGTFNPGNVGTYEGGNMIIFRLLGHFRRGRTDNGTLPSGADPILGGHWRVMPDRHVEGDRPTQAGVQRSGSDECIWPASISNSQRFDGAVKRLCPDSVGCPYPVIHFPSCSGRLKLTP